MRKPNDIVYTVRSGAKFDPPGIDAMLVSYTLPEVSIVWKPGAKKNENFNVVITGTDSTSQPVENKIELGKFLREFKLNSQDIHVYEVKK